MGGRTTTGPSAWDKVKGYFGGETAPKTTTTTTSTKPSGGKSVGEDMIEGAGAIGKAIRDKNKGLDYEEYPEKKKR